jgi:hypothetical protein
VQAREVMQADQPRKTREKHLQRHNIDTLWGQLGVGDAIV